MQLRILWEDHFFALLVLSCLRFCVGFALVAFGPESTQTIEQCTFCCFISDKFYHKRNLSCFFFSTKKCACSKDYIGAGCQLAWNGVALHNTWVVVNNYSNSNYFSTHLVGHSGSFVAPHLWIFGGYNLNRVYNHLLRYDFSSNTWFVVETARQPSPRYFHTVSSLAYCFVAEKLDYGKSLCAIFSFILELNIIVLFAVILVCNSFKVNK